jgi:hypothetical protein
MRGLLMPEGTLLYCRSGERGVGLAARLPDGGVVSVLGGEKTTLVAANPATRVLRVDWIVFTELGELGK